MCWHCGDDGFGGIRDRCCDCGGVKKCDVSGGGYGFGVCSFMCWDGNRGGG